MSPEEVKKLREELGCSARQLASALKVDARDVLGWESGEVFPTKRYVAQMEALRKKGKDAFPKPIARGVTGMARMSDPKLWEVVRKLCEHPKLFAEVVKLAEAYDDPSTETAGNAS